MPTKREQIRAQKAQAQKARYTQLAIVVGVLIVAVVAFWAFSPKEAAPVEPVATDAAAAEVPPAGEAPQVTSKQYAAAPEMMIDVNKQYFANFKMANGGEFVIQLYPDKAPITVNSFVFLARDGYFNGVTFHRVLDGFMAQGGDPTGTGAGGPGYEFVNEDSDLTFDKAGVVAMANAGRDTNGSQFFITFAPADF